MLTNTSKLTTLCALSFLSAKTQTNPELPERGLHGEDRTKGEFPH